ncbi:two-component system chemotaxis sensor kinase CheA [Sinobaca qinghaiensis]|uniref:Chemotaxis protein CheA n=1 Tax=Sinobaca qinghaiensis TaxID=342944 RepID=A0A419V6N6_9BACL|nr:chemotaxis protein CheA [Sinobaca qinghaiensis]RKD75654.1 two-component system chemotaxis sensor kinase CheA [Sinobaca qinghaiensis]
MDNKEYLTLFIEESQEHLQAVNTHLLELEKNNGSKDIISEIFRSAHTLKGMAATMGFEDLAHLTHHMENVLDQIRNDQLTVTPAVLDVVFESVDDLEYMINDISSGGSGKKDVQGAASKLEALLAGDKAAETASASNVSPEKHSVIPEYDQYEWAVIQESEEQGYHALCLNVTLDEQTMLKAARVFMVFGVVEKAGEVINCQPAMADLEAEAFENEFTVTLITKEEPENLQAQIAGISEVTDVHVHVVKKETVQTKHEEQSITEEKNQELSPPSNKAEMPQRQTEAVKTVRVNTDRLDKLMNLFEELVIDRGRLEQLSAELKHSELTDTVEHMSRISGDLQTIILTMRMMPVENVFNRFPRMVRSLSKELGKKIELDIVGADTELDRTIIDEIGDPLVHLLRNSLDHGIETPEVRKQAGKPETGTVTLRAYHSGNHVMIEMEDDGAGINKEKVIDIALSKGIIAAEDVEKKTDQDIYGLLFASGFSTAAEVTDISGRGVGLDVVRNTFESLGGIVSVDSEPGKGSIFSIQLPLTLSILDVMLVEAGEEKYAVPISSIVETAIITKDNIFHSHGQRVIDFRGRIIPLLSLHQVFAIPGSQEERSQHSIVVINKGGKIAALMVDHLVGKQDIVLKSLGPFLPDIASISGATILGDGNVALIVDVNTLIA